MRIYHSNRVDGWINQAECLCELHGAEKAVEALLLDEERFKKSARYVYAIGRYYALANEIQRAKEYVRRAIKMDGGDQCELGSPKRTSSIRSARLLGVLLHRLLQLSGERL